MIFLIFYSDKQKKDLIMSHYLNPKYKNDDLQINNKSIYLHSSSCVDEITLNYDLEKNFFEYKAQGCVIFLSSIEIFIERVLQIGFDNLNLLISLYKKLINQEILNETEKIFLDKLNIFHNVKRHLNRLECASLITNVFLQML